MSSSNETVKPIGTAIDRIRRRQLSLALNIGIPYFAAIIGMFLVVYLAGPSVAAVNIMGFPLHYWLVAVAVYPITWALFIWYVGKANRMEDDIEQEDI
ncbi:sodium/substrate symporter small subunit [Salidesulfovibrio brasiliensis]|uniref:sodium/substrate symporter small subunit n=1 Tax=Salidesulfovibrio brasiliensis TaxID=221711 RepID=UPI0006CF6431|nr:sodium/substrate symporter small subunit [Salidesulfovibrio brasiliensis]